VNVFDISIEGCKLEFVERPRLDETVWIKFEGYDAIQSTVCWVEDTLWALNSRGLFIHPFSR